MDAQNSTHNDMKNLQKVGYKDMVREHYAHPFSMLALMPLHDREVNRVAAG